MKDDVKEMTDQLRQMIARSPVYVGPNRPVKTDAVKREVLELINDIRATLPDLLWLIDHTAEFRNGEWVDALRSARHAITRAHDVGHLSRKVHK